MFHMKLMRVYAAVARFTLAKLNRISKQVAMNIGIPSIYQSLLDIHFVEQREPLFNLPAWTILSLGHTELCKTKIVEDFF